MKNSILFIFLIIIFLSGCASAIPMTSKISDAVMIRTKMNSLERVSFEYQSLVADGLIKPCSKDSRTPSEEHPGWIHAEGSLLGVMLKDYLAMKFIELSTDGDIRIKIILRDFWIERFWPDSDAFQLLVALGGGETSVVITVNLNIFFELDNKGNFFNRSFKISSDVGHVVGIGTRTETSRIYRGTQSTEFKIAEAINSANNKAIFMINQFLESQGL